MCILLRTLPRYQIDEQTSYKQRCSFCLTLIVLDITQCPPFCLTALALLRILNSVPSNWHGATMTVTYTRYLESKLQPESAHNRDIPKSPPRVWTAAEPPFKGYHAAPSEGYQQSSGGTAIVIDNGHQA